MGAGACRPQDVEFLCSPTLQPHALLKLKKEVEVIALTFVSLTGPSVADAVGVEREGPSSGCNTYM